MNSEEHVASLELEQGDAVPGQPALPLPAEQGLQFAAISAYRLGWIISHTEGFATAMLKTVSDEEIVFYFKT